jgi:beta-galactosidase
LVHEKAWAQMKDKPYVWGTFVWNLFDFAVNTRHEGAQPGRNDKGLVTYDRQTRKDAFYFYKANWNPEPMVHLTSHRFVDRTNAVISVKAYSNAQTVTLIVNGQTIAEQPNNGNDVFTWKSVPLNLGANHVVAQAVIHGQTVTDQCDWVRH